ncbi:adenylate kinase [Cryobacterium algoricola]|uniref:Adenylate kinase n=1 Tax=Cryobacterium algoricola TaxID=1259183 RepID=A0ABY2IFQ4_9MICO|nr:adenylate kinase [Cryobacterium algoricola]
MLVIGPPGAGKGTQAVRLAAAFGIPAVSTGDIFRYNVTNQTELGLKVKSFMDKGAYVPDSLTNEIVADRLAQADAADGFLLDGYPRTLDQVHELDRLLESDGAALDVVVQISADTDEVVARLLKRAAEQGRADDTADVIRHRLEVYSEQTAPLIDVYGARGLVVTVDGLGAVDAVTERILSALAERELRAVDNPDAPSAS